MRARFPLILASMALLCSLSLAAPLGTKRYANPEPAPGLTLPDLTSTTHDLTDYRGEVLVISFWATWCVPCIKEMPSLTRAADLLQNDGIRVVAVSVGEGAAEVQRFLARSPSDLMFLLDEEAKVSTSWDVRALPTAYVVDKQGRIAMRVIGGLEWDQEPMLQDLRNLAVR